MTLLVFDSGIGGLGVVRELRRLGTEHNITYLADNGFFPYGEKTDAVLLPHIVKLIGQAIEYFKPSMIVVACNTASTIALSALRAAYPVPFIGCVPPIKPAAAASKSKHIGVLATVATIRRPYLNDLISRFAPDCTIHSLGTPTLAECAEQKFRGAAVDIGPVVAPLFAQPGAATIDAVALGCTHYTFLLPEFQTLYPGIAWFDPALPVARQTLGELRHLTLAQSTQPGRAAFTAPLPEAPRMQTRLAAFGLETLCFWNAAAGP